MQIYTYKLSFQQAASQPAPVAAPEPAQVQRAVATQEERRSRRLAGAGLGTPHVLPVRTRRRRLQAEAAAEEVAAEEPSEAAAEEEVPAAEEEDDDAITWRCVICLTGIRSEKDAHILFPCRHTNIHSICAYQQILGAGNNTCGTCRANIEDHEPLSAWLERRAEIARREALASTFKLHAMACNNIHNKLLFCTPLRAGMLKKLYYCMQIKNAKKHPKTKKKEKNVKSLKS